MFYFILISSLYFTPCLYGLQHTNHWTREKNFFLLLYIDTTKCLREEEEKKRESLPVYLTAKQNIFHA